MVIARTCLAMILVSASAYTAEYFVGKQGSDANDGLSRENTFVTIQKGVNVLKPGDMLTILPGEYLGNVRRDGLGTNDVVTTIRAEIPGTVILRGDIPVEGFRKVEGARFAYMADIAVTGKVVVVNELDTLKILEKMPNVPELDFMPGVFYHDQAAGKIYVSTSDMQPADVHRYTATVIGTHGFYLKNPQRVIIEGLAVTGFNAENELHYSWGTMGGVWGIFIYNGKSCVIRDCRAWLNGWGIGLNSEAKTSGDNVIERCVAWANTSKFWSGDMGGLTGFAVRRDVIRDSIAFLNGMHGVNIYGTGTDGGTYGDKNVPGNDEPNKSRLVNNLAWGNAAGDYKVKTGVEYFHTAENCVGLGSYFGIRNLANCLIAGHKYENRYQSGATTSVDNIIFSGEKNINPDHEFADPENHDYRLQSLSRFRGAAPGGKDRGPFQYEQNIYYVRSDGADTADGLSLSNAWKTLPRAARGLRTGDTLYIQPGAYEGDIALSLNGNENKPIRICGRGHGQVLIRGRLLAKECSHVEFQRLCFNEEVKINKGEKVVFNNCQFQTKTTGLQVEKAAGLRVTHCEFTGFEEAGLMIGARPDQKSWLDKFKEALKKEEKAKPLSASSKVYMVGNIFDNRKGAGLWLDGDGALEYSDYNSYRDMAGAWKVGGKVMDFGEVRKRMDEHSRELKAEYADEKGIKVLKNPQVFAALGPFGKPVGLYRDDKPKGVALALAEKPVVHSLSATSADIEWMTTLPATCELVWGETSAGNITNAFDVNYFGTYSLTGLKPGQKYYFRVKSLRVPQAMAENNDAKPVELNGDAVSFTTLKQNAAPATYYVATDGKDTNSGLDRQNAWQAIQRAANKVNVGDTVLIAGGTYRERVRIRASGETNAPITFKCVPGEKVFMDGVGKGLSQSFVAGGKQNLNFDGFYFRDFNLGTSQGMDPMCAGEFNLYKCQDISITRCFSDGRGGYTAVAISAFYVKNLLVKNCVNLNKMGGGMYTWRCPDMRVENTVFAAPMIQSFVHRNEKTQKAIMENCIFTDMLLKKAALNIGLLCCDGYIDSFRMQNNCFFLRNCIPVEKRALNGKATISELGKYIVDPVFADPLFAGDPVVAGLSTNTANFPPDRMMELSFRLDFNSYFATNPELIKRGIGLQPEAFKDFIFSPVKPAAK